MAQRSALLLSILVAHVPAAGAVVDSHESAAQRKNLVVKLTNQSSISKVEKSVADTLALAQCDLNDESKKKLVEAWESSGLVIPPVTEHLVGQMCKYSLPDVLRLTADEIGTLANEIQDDDVTEYLKDGGYEGDVNAASWVLDLYESIFAQDPRCSSTDDRVAETTTALLSNLAAKDCFLYGDKVEECRKQPMMSALPLQGARRKCTPEELCAAKHGKLLMAQPDGTWKYQLGGSAAHLEVIGEEVEIKFINTWCFGGLCKILFEEGVKQLPVQKISSVYLLFMPDQRVAACLCYIRAALALGFKSLEVLWDKLGGQPRRKKARLNAERPEGWSSPDPEQLGSTDFQREWCIQNDAAMEKVPTVPGKGKRPALLPLWTFS